MTDLRPVRGTRDFLAEDSSNRRFIEETACTLAERYGFSEMSTPVMEFTSVFARTLGDTSDIVTKEMYTFEDRSGESITLRPENTAGIVRALITNKLGSLLPLKVFYRGPMFRYERPQKGRLRQFHQIGIELIGVAEPIADIEVIALAHALLDALGIGESCTLEINSLGDTDSRTTYRSALIEYLRQHSSQLSADSLLRMENNPLRVLDSKDPSDREVIAQAPSLAEHLNPPSRSFFEAVLAGLSQLGVPFRVNHRLVRGLDYYCHTAFEFVTDALGAQGTVLAGGRYDGLVEQMGGPPTPGIGWAAGIERLMMLCRGAPPASRPIAVLPLGDGEAVPALVIANRLRARGLCVDFLAAGGFGRRMKRANRIGALHAVILGSDELARGAVAVRNMDSGRQEEVAIDRIEDFFAGEGRHPV